MNRRVWYNFDIILFIATLLLLVYGVAMIYSASHDVERIKGSAVRQIIWSVAGIVLGFIVAAIDYRLLDAFAIPLYIIIVLLLVAVFIIGQITFGAQRSIDLGFVSVQPSEFSKPALIVILAAFFGRREDKIDRLSTLLFSIALIALPVFLIYKEPDLGTALVLIFVWGVMVFAAGMNLIYLGLLGGGAVGAVPILWLTMQDYMRQRVVTFLSPESDPESFYNIKQALYAIGSGGWLGKGYMKGTQSQLGFLLVQHTDFIFSVICEELGMLGAFALFALLAVVLLRILRAAKMARDTFGRLICTGIAAWFFFQIAVNIGMNLQLLPVTGLPLPFISYGGSSLVPMLVSLGLVQGVLMRYRKIEF
ncbi:MAG: rod shape-determining protein RodA [Anaerolineae bacterium]|nr:rod shape-determining protein RodA [Anaerolineae bacterium]